MEVKEGKFTKGNNALNPKKRVSTKEKDFQYEKLKKARKNRANRLNKKKKTSRKSIGLIIVMIFAIGVTVIGRDARVFNMQKKLSNIEKDIKNMVVENEALKVNLLKASSIENVKSVAQSKLQMTTPNKDNVIKIPNKENIVIAKDKSDNDKKSNFLQKIKDALIK